MNFLGKLQKSYVWIFAILFSYIWLLVIFVDKSVEYANKNRCTKENSWFFILGAIILVSGILLYNILIKKWVDNRTTKQSYIILIIFNIVVLMIQLFVVYNIYFQSGWDCGMLAETSDGIARGTLNINEGFYGEYYSRYPNNVWLVFCLTLVKKLVLMLGFEDTYFASIIVGVVGVNIACYLSALVTNEITDNRHCVVFTYLVMVGYVGLSPWCVIPYSDTYSILFTTLVLYLYVSKSKAKNEIVRKFFIVLLSLFGYAIKPTAIILLIAIIIIELLKIKEPKIWLKNIMSWLVIMIVSALILKGSVLMAKSYIGLEANQDRQFSMIHYLMMGLNENSTGGYYSDDVEFSASFENQEVRKEANLDVIRQRINEEGARGLFVFESKKLLMNNNNGSFAWTGEGSFYKIISEKPDTGISRMLRSYFYAQDNANIFNFMQCIWIMIISLNVIEGWYAVRNGAKEEGVIMLTLIGMTLFILLFEGRARYMILYSPFYVMTAGIGLMNILRKFTNIRDLINKMQGENHNQ